MRTFDCFTFYNEFDLLELRLEELWDVVDYFVIAEANTTHQNNSKPYYLKDNWERFKKYSDKIRHIIVDDMPQHSDTWINERHQRAALGRGLQDLQATDIVIVSDLDEIPRPGVIDFIKSDTTETTRYLLGMPIFYYKFNYMMIHPVARQTNIKVTRGNVFIDTHVERSMFDFWPGVKKIEHGGWHFTYFGNTEFALNKIFNFAHSETAGLISQKIGDVNKLDVDWMISNKVGLGGLDGNERFEYVAVNEYFPKTITENIEKYQKMILPNTTKTVYDFYPR